jgi:hypothetical protein
MNARDQTATNPLLQPWTAPHGLPPFAAIKPEHFAPAFEVAMREHRTERFTTSARRRLPMRCRRRSANWRSRWRRTATRST